MVSEKLWREYVESVERVGELVSAKVGGQEFLKAIARRDALLDACLIVRSEPDWKGLLERVLARCERQEHYDLGHPVREAWKALGWGPGHVIGLEKKRGGAQ